MPDNHSLSRREFIRLAGTSLGAFLLPIEQAGKSYRGFSWPMLRLDQIPSQVQEILDMVPYTMVSRDGHLILMDIGRQPAGRIPLAQTQWNREKNHKSDRLYSTEPRGIVMHWYGDRENFDKSISGYLRGFDSLRQVIDYETRTSAHFLIGDAVPTTSSNASENSIGIIQTQKPDADGTPYVASHLSGLDYGAHLARRQYFVRALYQLELDEPGVHSILQDWFDGGRSIDPNMRTIAIEMTGYDFENREHYPANQQIANAVSVIWAVMRRYGITANNLFGHHELQLNKPDPGKKFMALIRYLIGAKALLENDHSMNQLVFGSYLLENVDTLGAVKSYFKFVYDHLLLVSKPNRVYEWEGLSGYWFLSDLLDNRSGITTIGRRFLSPLTGKYSSPGRSFTLPANHEGIDLHRDANSNHIKAPLEGQALLVTNGICIYLGENDGCRGGRSAIFRHRQLNGCQVLSVYGHLDKMFDLNIGSQYPIHYPIGEIKKDHDNINPFLHFAMAYGGTWNTDLKARPSIPQNVGASWIKARYLNPFNLMDGGYGGPSSGNTW